jgi:hypothetical protein
LRARASKASAVAASPPLRARRAICASSACRKQFRSIGTKLVVRVDARSPSSSNQRELKSQPDAAAARSSR